MYTPFAHAICIRNKKKTPYAFFAKITLCMYILCVWIKNGCRHLQRHDSLPVNVRVDKNVAS